MKFKAVSAVILSLMIIVMNAHFGLQFVIYQMFKPAIIEQFCINKDQPDLECEAMCFMNETAKEHADASESSTTEKTVSIKLLESDCRAYNTQVPACPVTALFSSLTGELKYTLPSISLEIPHAPPQVS